MVVQHNMQAANASRMLNVVTGQQSKTTEKLASGYKINRAADDAAGLSISEKMRKQIRGLDQASTNAQDGVSAVQTAEGALTEVHSMLQRMNELATQAANGTNSKTDRDSIQAEIDQLTTEIDRVAETTKFNETYILKGDASGDTKKVNLSAHDAGLAGKLTEKADGTATFKMDSIKNGSKVTIGGTSYTIGTTQTDTKKAITDAAKAIKGSTGETIDVTVDGETYTIDNAGAITKGADAVYVLKDGTLSTDEPATSKAATVKDVAALVKEGSTASILKSGETVADEFTVLTDSKGGADGVDDNNAQLISASKAYDLAAAELLTANKIGDTENTGVVTRADNDSKAAKASDFAVGDKVTIDGTQYTLVKGLTEKKAAVNDALTGATLANGDKITIDGKDYVYAKSQTNSATTSKINITDGWYEKTVFDALKADTTESTAGTPAAEFDAKMAASVLDTTATATEIVKLIEDDSAVSTTIATKATGKADANITAPNTTSEKTITQAVDAINKLNEGTFNITVGSTETTKALNFNLHVGSDADMTNKINVNVETMNSKYLGISGLNVSDETGMSATYAVDAIADALAKVSSTRSTLGAVQNRLEHTIDNVDNVVENTTSAESRIRDTDMADEMVKFSKNNILAQAGQSMLAQANQSTQGVLSILG